MKQPTSRKIKIKFIGVINHYHNMCPRWSHMLAPLYRLRSIKREIKWAQVKQDAFEKIIGLWTAILY